MWFAVHVVKVGLYSIPTMNSAIIMSFRSDKIQSVLLLTLGYIANVIGVESRGRGGGGKIFGLTA